MQGYRYGELFCGAGGFALGAVHHKQIVHTWGVDMDVSACETYRQNIHPNVICADVQKLDISKLGDIDIFAYGFPCNDFSIIGKQQGLSGKHGCLYRYGIDVINTYDPLVIVAENVSGISNANDRTAFTKILSDLELAGDGYHLTVHLYKSEAYGVPQRRHRYIIIGFRRDMHLYFKVPKPTHNQYKTAGMALSNIPEDAYNHEMPKMAEKTIERLKYIKPGENVWTAEIPEHLTINTSTKLSNIYRRLERDRPAYTVTACGGGGTHMYHYREDRQLTNRERARLQTFPDGFKFYGTETSVRKQIGMAVPPRLSYILFNAILKTLNKIDYDYVSPNYYHNIQLEMW